MSYGMYHSLLTYLKNGEFILNKESFLNLARILRELVELINFYSP